MDKNQGKQTKQTSNNPETSIAELQQSEQSITSVTNQDNNNQTNNNQYQSTRSQYGGYGTGGYGSSYGGGYGSSYGGGMYGSSMYGGGGGMYGNSMYGGGGMYGGGMYGNQMNPQGMPPMGFRQEYQGVLNGLQSMLSISYGGIMLLGYGQFLLRTSKKILQFIGSKSKSLFIMLLGIKYWKQLIRYLFSGQAEKDLAVGFKTLSKKTNEANTINAPIKRLIQIIRVLGLITMAFAFKQYTNVKKSLKQQKQKQQQQQLMNQQLQNQQYKLQNQLNEAWNDQEIIHQNQQQLHHELLQQNYNQLHQLQNSNENMESVYSSIQKNNLLQKNLEFTDNEDDDSEDIEIDFSYQPSRKSSFIQEVNNEDFHDLLKEDNKQKNEQQTNLNNSFNSQMFQNDNDDDEDSDIQSELNITQDSQIQVKVNFNALNKKKDNQAEDAKEEEEQENENIDDNANSNKNNNDILDQLNTNNLNDRSKEWNFGHQDSINNQEQQQTKSMINNAIKPLDLNENSENKNINNNINLPISKSVSSVKPWLKKKSTITQQTNNQITPSVEQMSNRIEQNIKDIPLISKPWLTKKSNITQQPNNINETKPQEQQQQN